MAEPEKITPDITPDVNSSDAKSARKDIEDFIQHINQSNFNQAEKTFKDMIGGRLGDVLDQQKAKIAGQIFQQTDAELPEEEPEVEEEEQQEFEDEVEVDFEEDEEETETEN
jgi:hypothetical protein